MRPLAVEPRCQIAIPPTQCKLHIFELQAWHCIVRCNPFVVTNQNFQIDSNVVDINWAGATEPLGTHCNAFTAPTALFGENAGNAFSAFVVPVRNDSDHGSDGLHRGCKSAAGVEPRPASAEASVLWWPPPVEILPQNLGLASLCAASLLAASLIVAFIGDWFWNWRSHRQLQP